MQTRQETGKLVGIGNTPLIRLESLNTSSVKFFAKLEWFNRFGSLKDRPAYRMLKEAERNGLIHPGKTFVIEPTSGNTGIALAGIAKVLDYKVQLVVPERISHETKRIARALGAVLLETEDDLCPRVGKGTDQSIALAEAIIKGHPGKYYMPNQYVNEANFLSHYEGTGPEIWNDTNGMVTHFITGIGTGGTVTGVSKFLKEKNPKIKTYAVQPQKNHHIQGLRNLEESSMPELLERRAGLIDEWMTITDEEAFSAVRGLADNEGIFVGPSSGATVAAAKKVASEVTGGNLVIVFSDDGRKYGSIYTEFNVFRRERFDWLSKNGKFLRNIKIFGNVLD